ncbi:MAG: glutathione synthase [Myxococcales bacterium]|nr:glutathione synthase [Myxococcales bacterium]
MIQFIDLSPDGEFSPLAGYPSQMNTLYLMDPLSGLNLAGDSTFMLMLEGTRRGYPSAWCTPGDLYAREGAVAWARCQAVSTFPLHNDGPQGFQTGGQREVPLTDFDVIWMRKDPPFDMSYIFCTYLLEMAVTARSRDGRGATPRTCVYNHPEGLRSRNEKLFALQYEGLTPRTLVSHDIARIVEFAEELPGKMVIKPWDGNGGRGVLVSGKGDPNLRSMVELLTSDGKQFILAQQHLPAIAEGDKRILLVDGRPVGAMLRVPSPKDHRGNMHVGATVHRCELTSRDHEICEAIGPTLQREGQLFVGIDVIGGFLTEINVTSPTGIQEVNRLDGQRVERLIWDALESRQA